MPGSLIRILGQRGGQGHLGCEPQYRALVSHLSNIQVIAAEIQYRNTVEKYRNTIHGSCVSPVKYPGENSRDAV
jgi:hypothetical protein